MSDEYITPAWVRCNRMKAVVILLLVIAVITGYVLFLLGVWLPDMSWWIKALIGVAIYILTMVLALFLILGQEDCWNWDPFIVLLFSPYYLIRHLIGKIKNGELVYSDRPYAAQIQEALEQRRQERCGQMR